MSCDAIEKNRSIYSAVAFFAVAALNMEISILMNIMVHAINAR
jgi:hypothetical protein